MAFAMKQALRAAVPDTACYQKNIYAGVLGVRAAREAGDRSRYVLIGRVQWLAVRDDLVDAEKWRVRLQACFPVGRFGASFYVDCRERFAI